MNCKTPLALLTEDMITQINRAVEAVVEASGFGEVVIVIERGVPRWIRPAPSLPLETPVQSERT